MGNAMNLQELQKRMESQQATLAELLKVLKPVSGTSSLELGGADGAYALPLPSESVIKGWDSARDGPYSGASPARRRRSNKVATRQEGLTKRERYLAVEGYWRSMSEEGRRAILAAPVCRVVEAATAENGAEAGKEVSEGVRLLKRNASRHACYWRCPCCELRTADPRGFLEHMAQYHEEVQYACEDTPLLCTTCGQEVVGAFYHTGDPREPSAVRCMRCAWESSPPAAPGVIPKGWAIHVPQPTGLLDRSWSGSEEGSEALTASSRSSEASATGSDGEEHFSDPDADGSEGALAAETGALEARIRSGADGLLQAIVDRIDALSKEDSHQFATAKAAVWQQAQSLLHSASSGQEIGVVKEVPPGPGSEQRTAAVARLADAEGYPNQQEVLNEAMELLDPSEQQDLVALVARKYNPHARASQSQGKKAPYEPPCVSLLRLEATDGGRVGEDALAGDPSESEVVVPIPGTGLTDLPELSDSDVLRAHSWWTDHLIQKSRSAATATGGAADDTYLLQWIYGNVAHGASDEFHERQRQACGTKTAERTIMDAYGEVAETWRHLAATMDRKRAITTLRDNVVEDMESVATFNPATGASLFAQANEFIAEVAADHTLASAAAGTAEMDGAWAQRALTKLQRFHQLKDEASIRYAQALIDREIAVLELAEMVDQHECDVSERELQTVDAALAAARQDLADAEAELARTQAEGPPLHRKRDLLDRVNKEAEHRERLRELQQHIAACKDRIASEEAFGTSTRRRREEAAAALSEVRTGCRYSKAYLFTETLCR